MSCIPFIAQSLRQRGYRVTPQRVAVLQALHDGGHLSPLDIFGNVRHTGMTEATVYRTLEFLQENDIIYSAQNQFGHLTYELAGHAHHHLICRKCGAQVKLEPEAIQDILLNLEGQTGYNLKASHLTIFGLCPACQHLSQ